MRRRIVIVGASFAGLAAALDLKARLGAEHDVVVVSDRDEFIFLPSLIWVPFGVRRKDEISFPIAPLLERRGIGFVHQPATALDLAGRAVVTPKGREAYDFLVIATGPKLAFEAVPGLGPRNGYSQSIFSWPHAELARRAFERFVDAPGPVVIGAVPGAQFFGAAYELALNFVFQLRQRGISPQVAPVTFVTPEPYLGHLGIGGSEPTRHALERLFDRKGIAAITNAATTHLTSRHVHLASGAQLPFAFAMLTPPFVGVDAVRACEEIVDADGFVRVEADLSVRAHSEVFAAGSSVSIDPIEPTTVPCGAPRTGHMAEKMAAVVARNIAARIAGQPTTRIDLRKLEVVYTLDGGNDGLILARDRFLAPHAEVTITPGTTAHWAKSAHERWFLAMRRRGVGDGASC